MKKILTFQLCLALSSIFCFPNFAQAVSFSDQTIIPSWANSAVELVQSKKIMTGFPDGTFRPDQSLTRAEALTILLRAKGMDIQSENYSSMEFTDVPAGIWFFPVVQKARKEKFIVVETDRKFRPGEAITKAEFFVLTQRIFNLKNTGKSPEFFYFDVPEGDWFYDAVYTLLEKNLVREKTKNFNPHSTITRADSAWIISSLLTQSQEKEKTIVNKSIRKVFIKPRNLDIANQSVETSRQEILVNAKKQDPLPSFSQKNNEEWQDLGKFTFLNAFDKSAQLHALELSLRFEKTDIGPVSNFQVQIIDPQNKTVEVTVGMGGDIFYGGRKDIIAPGKSAEFQIKIKPDAEKTYFLGTGKGRVQLLKVNASLVQSIKTTGKKNSMKNSTSAPLRMETKELLFEFSFDKN